MEWLEDEGWSADADTYETKLSELKALTKPAWKRVSEAKERPEAISALKATINGSRFGFCSAQSIDREVLVL